MLLFPVASLFFLIPLPGIDQATVRLQLLVTKAANLICNLIGIHLMAVGTTLRAMDRSFNFEIAGGCSGMNSLMAITLMTAVFAHLTQDRLWKQIVLFAASVPVAIIGNIARLVAIMIVAKCFGQEIAGGWFHDISSYVVSFPFAFGALCLVQAVLNWKPGAPPGNSPPRERRRISTPGWLPRQCPMIIKRLLILQVIIALGLGSVFLLPKKTGIGPAGIALTLPGDVGIWKGVDAVVTPEELQGLAPDTGFARRLYTDSSKDSVYVSIVLSGSDMTNSIHRPERCLPAQGWTVEHSQRVEIPNPPGAPLAVTKLTNVREAQLSPNTLPVPLRQLTYYWFIGSRDVTPSHWERTYIDVRDRMLHGENQRWAYVTVASTVTDNLRPSGRSEAETSKMVEDFIREIVPQFQRPHA